MCQPNQTGAPAPTDSSASAPQHEQVRHLLIGGRRGILHTIKVLYAKGYADPNDWSDLLPTGRPDEWMSILTKRWRIE